MPVTPTYPGVYIEEVPSGVRTIVGVATANTAFVGNAQRGPTNLPVTVNNLSEYERTFGSLQVNSLMGYSVRHFFQNGGTIAIIIRVADENAVKSSVDVGNLPLEAAGEGKWGDSIRARIDHDTSDREATNPTLFNLYLQYRDEDDSSTELREIYRNVSTDKDHPRYIEPILQLSLLARLASEDNLPPRPDANEDPSGGASDVFNSANEGSSYHPMSGGNDGGAIENEHVIGRLADKSGMYALERTDLFNMLCLPPPSRNDSISAQSYATALAYCLKRRALLLVDAPSEWTSVGQAVTGLSDFSSVISSNDAKNAAIFFPRFMASDPLRENRLTEFAPSGAIAGICAKTDVQRGVWKSPAGLDAALSGVKKLSVTMTDDENGRLNPLGVNCLRTFPIYGHVVWGSRTMAGADRLASEWKYLAIRRFTLFLEESLYRGTHWVVFEPNDEPLWSQIRLNVGSFMQGLFRQGAFQGNSPSKAYFVRCDEETTTQDDIDRGIVNIHVGFAPLKPAEFVILKIQQLTGRETDA